MDADEVHFIPKVTTTSTTPSTPSSKLPSVLTSLDIPPGYLEEILRPRNAPKVPREPPLPRQPQQEAPAPQQTPEGHSREKDTVEGSEDHKRTLGYQKTPLTNAAESHSPDHVESQKQDVKVESSQVPPLVQDSKGGEGSPEKTRWRWGWWNEEPSDVQIKLEEASTGPRFDRTLARRVTVQEGKTAVLACRVLTNSEKAVRVTSFCWFLRGVTITFTWCPLDLIGLL